MSVEEALKLLDRYNKGLRKWAVTRGSESSGASGSDFACLMDDRSLEAIKVCSFRPFCDGSGDYKTAREGLQEGVL